jgi:KaiC/GvpD/RAD55 family RecA-like ATPase
VLPAKKNEAGVAWGWPAKDSSADWHHLELRWANTQTVLPPTPGYQWRGKAPTEAPAEVPIHRVLAAFFALCPTPDHTIGSLDDTTKDAIRERFDLVGYAVEHFGGEVQTEGSAEVRVLGHGGLLINQDKGIWHCFGDDIGGDCFELVAYNRYRTALKNLNGKSAEIVKETATYAGVTLPERQPDQALTTDTSPHVTDMPTDTSVVSVPAPRFVIRTEDDLAKLPPLQWLQPEELLSKGYHLIYGASGSGKTFYAVRRAMLSAEAGRRVLYVATEDLTGLKHRVAAWRRAFPERQGLSLTWLEMPEELDLQDTGQVHDLLTTIRSCAYDHIIIDTLREAHSGDENSSQDGAAINRAIQRIIRETGAAVDVVHHSGVEDRRPRGTTAIFGNADMVLRVSKDEEVITIHYDKIRNSTPLEDKRFALTNPAPNCLTPVLRPIDNYTRRDVSIGRIHKAILEALSLSVFAETGAKTRELLSTAEGVNERTIYRSLSDLKDKGFVSQSTKGDPYYITPAGRAQLLPSYVTATDKTASASLSPTDATDIALTTVVVSEEDIPTVLTDTDTDTLKGVSVSQWSQSVKSDVTQEDDSDHLILWHGCRGQACSTMYAVVILRRYGV